jgi:DNA-binding NarL/FixJ family response regulator
VRAALQRPGVLRQSVAVSTVDRHLTHIYQKLGVCNRAEATAVALKKGLA